MRKLLISYFVVAFIPITVLGVFSYVKSMSYIEAQLRVSMNDNANQIIRNISSRLDKDNEFFLRFTAISPFFLIEDVSDNDNMYELAKLTNKYFEPVTWYNLSLNRDYKELIIYYENLKTQRGSFFYPSDWVKNDQVYIDTSKSNETLWNIIGDEFIATRRIYDVTQQSLTGVIYLSMDLDYIMDTAVARGEHAFGLILTDSQDHIIYSKDYNQDRQNEKFYNELIHYSGEKATIDSKKYFITKKIIPNQKWSLYYYTPVTGYQSNIQDILKATISIICVCLIIVICLIYFFFSKTLVTRIHRLNRKMKAVEDGNMTIRVQSNSTDEIGELTNRFGMMLQRINQLIEEVYKSKIVVKEAELKALQSQINPHFLYNTLSLINWKAIEIESEEISEITGFISKFYRTSLNKGDNLIPIKDEIDNIKAYIDIQLIMHDHSFDVIYHIDPKVYPYNTINFILQPIVENAIIHGIDHWEDDNFRGVLTIDAYVVEDGIVFTIKDNGVGMGEDKVKAIVNHHSKGYGIKKNVNERMKIFFGENYGITIKSAVGKGTIVTAKVGYLK